MTIAQSPAFQAAASLGRRTFLDLGAGNATIEIYGNVRPDPGVSAGATPLVVLTLSKPCGDIVDGFLVLELADPTGDLITESGTATWARFLNGDGQWAFDADVSLDGEDGEVQFPSRSLFAGGRAPISLGMIG